MKNLILQPGSFSKSIAWQLGLASCLVSATPHRSILRRLGVLTGGAMLAAFAFGAGNNALAASTASQTLRPSYVDLSSTTSPGAVLMTLSGYTAGSAPKHRLYNGSSQYNCWDAASGTFISSTTYSDGPTAPGDYVNGTTFWILLQRGNNNSVTASYRDRVSPYSVNNNTVSLSAATAMSSPFLT